MTSPRLLDIMHLLKSESQIEYQMNNEYYEKLIMSNLMIFLSFRSPKLGPSISTSYDSICIFSIFRIFQSVMYFQIVKTEFSSGLSGREVYLFPWYGAKPAHIEKYCDQLYGKFKNHKLSPYGSCRTGPGQYQSRTNFLNFGDNMWALQPLYPWSNSITNTLHT